MHMSFWWDYVQDNFLFPGYDITTAVGFFSTCLGLTSLSIILEWLKLLQARHRQKEILLRAKQIRSLCPTGSDTSNLLAERSRQLPKNITLWTRFQLMSWEVFLWLNLQVFGYLLMMAVMGFNGWMAISIILGSAIGYFCFGPCFIKINLENCQVLRETFCAASCADTEHDGETTPVLQASTSSMMTAPNNESTATQNETAACVHHHTST